MFPGFEYLTCVVREGKVSSFLGAGLDPEMFVEPERPLFDAVRQHVQKHGVLPSEDTFVGLVANQTIGFKTKPTPEPPSFYLDKLRDRYRHTTLIDALQQADALLSKKKSEEALAALQGRLTRLSLNARQANMKDFRAAKDYLVEHYTQALSGGPEGSMYTGWPTYDSMTNGVLPGDLVSIVGRPASGKTYFLLWIAHHCWAVHKKVPLFVSMEMSPASILQRLIAIHAKANATHVKTGLMASDEFKNIVKSLSGVAGSEQPFWVVDGSLSATVPNIHDLALQLKPDVVFVDGAYLLRTGRYSRDRFSRVGETAEEIKQVLCTDLMMPTFASYQLNRESVKLKGGKTPGVEHIARADDIGQLSTVVLGLMQEETVETLLKRTVSILKGRHGEMGSFDVNWRFDHTDFSERPKLEHVSQLQFLSPED